MLTTGGGGEPEEVLDILDPNVVLYVLLTGRFHSLGNRTLGLMFLAACLKSRGTSLTASGSFLASSMSLSSVSLNHLKF